MQKNHITGNEYSGGNADTLNHIQGVKGYKSNEWLTFLQAKEKKLQVLKGSKGVRLMKVCDNEKDKTKHFIKCFTVFNVEQTAPVNQ